MAMDLRKRKSFDWSKQPLAVECKRRAESSQNVEEECDPTIFDTLNFDCLNALLDFLSLKSVCALGKACRSLRSTTKNYFRFKYPSYDFTVGDEFIFEADHIDCFGDDVQELDLYDSSINDFIFAGLNINKQLRQIEFSKTYKEDNIIGKQHIDSIASILQNVKTVRAIDCKFGNGCLEYLLEHCKNIEDFAYEIDKDLSKTHFQFQKYPTLRNIQIEFDSKANVLEAMKMINEQNLQLNELVLSLCKEHNVIMKSIFNELDAMYQRNCFKRLYLMFEKKSMIVEHIDRLALMEGLLGITCSYTINTKADNHTADISKLQRIKFLNINWLLGNADQMAQELNNLEELEISEVSIDALFSFVRYSAKLTKLHIFKIRAESGKFDAFILNKSRAMLEYARKLVIYIPEERFIKLKWSQKTMDTHLVEIKREESCIPQRKN